MKVERSIGQIVNPDRQELNFQKQVEAWADGEILYEKVLESLPDQYRNSNPAIMIIRAFKGFIWKQA